MTVLILLLTLAACGGEKPPLILIRYLDAEGEEVETEELVEAGTDENGEYCVVIDLEGTGQTVPVNAGTDAPATAAPPTDPPATAAPDGNTTVPGTTAGSASTTGSPDSPTADQSGSAEQPGVAPTAKADIISLYNTAANNTKAYKGKVVITETDGTVSELIKIDMEFIVGKFAKEVLPNDWDPDEKGVRTFVNGVDENDPNKTLINFLPPENREEPKMSGLTEAGVKDAKCSVDGDGYLVEITLNEEKTTVLNEVPPQHGSAMNTLDMTEDDLGDFTLGSADITYEGAVIKARINKDKTLDRYEVFEPVNIKGVFGWRNLNILNTEIQGDYKHIIEFSYQ